jgi:hypothetical protein
MRKLMTLAIAASGLALASAQPVQASVYLNKDLITVAVGAGTSPGSFNNTFTNSPGLTINKVIDAPTAASAEFHNQDTHIWFTAANPGGGLELLFDFQQEYDISTLHFWNYDGEDYDVDNVNFTFFNGANAQVGTLSAMPALGSSPAIFAEDIVLAAPLNVRYVRAFLTGTNQQVDFQNIGFTANVSVANAVPEPATWAMMLFGFGLVGGTMRRRSATGVSATV